MKGMMKVKLVIALLVVIAVAIFYYVSLPAINIHATETWKFIFLILAVLFVLYIVRKAKIAGQSKIELSFIKEYTGLKIGVIVFLLFLAVYVAGSILSSPIVNAAKYQKLLKVEEGEFTEDIKQISYDQIPLLDRDSASILGNRKMGSLVDMASQFEVSELYSQINYKGEPVRVTPLFIHLLYISLCNRTLCILRTSAVHCIICHFLDHFEKFLFVNSELSKCRCL